jgi:hypothetical protein
VKGYAGILLEKLLDQPGLVSREIIEDDVDLLAGWAEGNDFLQKADEVLTGVACGGLAMDAAGCRIQRCI